MDCMQLSWMKMPLCRAIPSHPWPNAVYLIPHLHVKLTAGTKTHAGYSYSRLPYSPTLKLRWLLQMLVWPLIASLHIVGDLWKQNELSGKEQIPGRGKLWIKNFSRSEKEQPERTEGRPRNKNLMIPISLLLLVQPNMQMQHSCLQPCGLHLLRFCLQQYRQLNLQG